MDNIVQNLGDVSWWFTGIFFILVGMLLTKVIHWLTNIPAHANGFIRKLTLKRLRKIKSIRFDETKVIVEAVKASAWQVTFILTLILFCYSFSATRFMFSSADKSSWLIYFLYTSPLYIIESMYHWQMIFYKRLIESRDLLRKTNRSRKT